MYGLARNDGWVSVGIDHDTASFAVRTIRRWWQNGLPAPIPGGTQVMITADGGAAKQPEPSVEVGCTKWPTTRDGAARVPLPPGTSKWNRIEHRLFSFITRNWRGRPLTSYEVIVSLIGTTTTQSGLTVRAASWIRMNMKPASRSVMKNSHT